MTASVRLLAGAAEVKAARGELQALAGRHHLLSSVDLYAFRGARVYAVGVRRGPGTVALLAAYFGKRPKKDESGSPWGPYVNLYLNYTAAPYRRQGLTGLLYERMLADAAEAGCQRLKSLAGSTDGALFQLSRGHLFWGRTEGGELYVDTPMSKRRTGKLDGNPPGVPGALMTKKEVLAAVKLGMPHDRK